MGVRKPPAVGVSVKAWHLLCRPQHVWVRVLRPGVARLQPRRTNAHAQGSAVVNQAGTNISCGVGRALNTDRKNQQASSCKINVTGQLHVRQVGGVRLHVIQGGGVCA
jgi:hypothetical protein